MGRKEKKNIFFDNYKKKVRKKGRQENFLSFGLWD